jgi:cation-transporting ATPase 13A2
MALWWWDGYRFYTICIFVISSGSIIASLIESISNNERVRKMARYACPVDLLQRDGSFKQISSEALLPGDVVRVPQGLILPCDFILLTGGVIVNEAMLTGESIPVMKASLPMTTEVYSDSETARHTLFGGTSVIQIRPVGKEDVKALVRSTGFMTSKGALVRDILYPKVLKFKFYTDSLKFVGIMGLIAFIGFLISLPAMLRYLSTAFIIDKSLNLVTITIPPALPAAMTCGTLFAINRLKGYNIFCISPQRINVAGRIKTFVFDKTGTLTEEGLSVLGFRSA